MTITELATRRMTAADRKAAAVSAYVDAHQRGEPMTGAELGRRFDMSEGWGRQRRSEALSLLAVDDTAAIDAPFTDDEPSTGSDCQIRETTSDVTSEIAVSRDRVRLVLALFAGLMAGVGSFGHLYDVALTSGEPTWLAWTFPLSIDVLVVAAHRARNHGWLLLAVTLSVIGNVGSRFPEAAETLGPAVAVVPVVCAYGAHSLISEKEGR